ncbi:hypothetical protein [Vulcanisaeta thermophila]|uniref:hypothetical protein n=1 Tax=Vulcanisaeta thermophila TaxID=867917 RepID=UPI000852A4D8|nr:hypothetical protein [Vulcanisaeta thermophila]
MTRRYIIGMLPLILMVVMAVVTPMFHGNAQVRVHDLLPRKAPAASLVGAFAYVANFEFVNEPLSYYGLIPVVSSPTQPQIVTYPNYWGEPSLSVSGYQELIVNPNLVVRGDQFLSFQVAINAQQGSGFFGLVNSNYQPVAIVGVANGYVWAGPNLTDLKPVIPLANLTNALYPPGWVLIMVNVYNASTPYNKTAGWVMQVFVDETDEPPFEVSVPNAGNYYTAAIINVNGTVYYTNIVLTTLQIPIYLVKYNNMEGYGQGSGLLVQLLPPFYNLTALVLLRYRKTPQVGILSFQINAMNYYGATRSSCVGFFQIGIDLDPNGTIAPWYVPGKNCIAHYYFNETTMNPAVLPGVPTPNNTLLKFMIYYNMSAKEIVFEIVDYNTSQVWIHEIPYSGTPFYATYTQLEFQYAYTKYPIYDYVFNGTMFDIEVTYLNGTTATLPANYMIPFELSAPLTWDLTYYNVNASGYVQLAK